MDSSNKMLEEKFKVLIVDDEDLVRETLKLIITRMPGFHAYEAPDGYKALEILYKYPIDVILLDVNLPGLNGLEVLKMLRQAGYTVPVILMTGYPSLELSVEALRSGATDFLIKPFTSHQLKTALEKVKENKNKPIEETSSVLVRLLKQKIREQTILFTVSDRLTSSRNAAQLYKEMVSLSREFTSSDEAILYLLDLKNFILLPVVWDGLSTPPSVLELDKESHPAVKVYKESMPYLVTGHNGQKSIMAVPFQIKGEILGTLLLFRQEPFHQEDLFVANIVLERAVPLAENFILYESIFLNLHDALRALVKTLEAKDPYTKEHSERVTNMAIRLGKILNIPEGEMESLRFAGHLHDIGKVGIQDRILLKPGKLTPEEYEIIKKHPLIGAEIVGHITLLKDEVLIIKHHHERWDGHGYPYGLAGEEIPFLARILAVADAYDAMTSQRPYRPPLTHEEAVQEIKINSGSQFDPQVVDAFLKLCEKEISWKGHNDARAISEFIT